MENRIIILTRGIQGSGKSTWAKEWVSQDPSNRIRFNNDDVRFSQGVYMLPDKRENDRKEKLVREIRDFTINLYMTNGYNIVIDNMNLSPKVWEDVKQKIEKFNKNNTQYNYSMEFKDFFNISVNDCIKRDAAREFPIGEKVIRSTFKKYRNFIISQNNQNYVKSLRPAEKEKQNCIIVDIDATLCFNVSGRPFFGEDIKDRLNYDVPCDSIINIVQKYINDENIKVFFVTGREDITDWRENTLNWLKQHVSDKITDDMLLMRDKNNHISGDVCKKDICEKKIFPYYNVLFAIDDSNKVVNMYRNELGITCIQPIEGIY